MKGDLVEWSPGDIGGLNFENTIEYTGTLEYRNPGNDKQWHIKWTDGYHDDEDSYWPEYELTHIKKESE